MEQTEQTEQTEQEQLEVEEELTVEELRFFQYLKDIAIDQPIKYITKLTDYSIMQYSTSLRVGLLKKGYFKDASRAENYMQLTAKGRAILALLP